MTNGNEFVQSISTTSGPYGGLTKRELFAAMALQGMLANDWAEYRHNDQDCRMIAAASVNYADALIEQLNKTKQP